MNARQFLSMLVLAAIWGGSFMLFRVAVPEFGAVLTAFGRVFFAALGLVAFLLVLRLKADFEGMLPKILLLGALNAGLPFLMFAYAAEVLPAGYSAIINAMTPVMAVVVGGMFFAQATPANKLLGVLIGFLGVVALAGAGPVPIEARMLLGIGQCLIATLCYAIAGLLTNRWLVNHPSLDKRVVALGSMCGASLFVLPFAIWNLLQNPIDLLAIGAVPWLSLLLLGVVGTSLAFVLFYGLLAEVGALNAMLVTFMIPPFGVFWGWLLLNEPVGIGHVIGGVLILLALMLVLRPSGTGFGMVNFMAWAGRRGKG